jgi:hypothetical protein
VSAGLVLGKLRGASSVGGDIVKSRASFLVPVLSFTLAALALSGLASAEGAGVTEANPTCSTATALLLTGDGNAEPERWAVIRKVVSAEPKWRIVAEAPVNRVEEVAFTRFDVRHTYKGGPTAAYTVQCGHGGTCNEVAQAFRKENPALSPAPVVICGDPSNVLVNPRPAP